MLQLCGSALPLIALVAWPHRPAPDETAITVAIDITVLVFLTGFLYWSLIIAPANNPTQASIGAPIARDRRPARPAGVGGRAAAGRRSAAGQSAWADGVPAPGARDGARVRRSSSGCRVMTVQRRLRHRIAGRHRLDAAVLRSRRGRRRPSPASRRRTRLSPTRPLPQASPVLLFVALLSVPIVGYGLRYLMPLGEPVDTLRDIATACTLVCGIALVLVRLRVEQRARRAGQPARCACWRPPASRPASSSSSSGATAAIEYANDAFCRATGYTLEELESLVAAVRSSPPESSASIPIFNESLQGRQGDARRRRRSRARTAARFRQRASRRRSSTPPAA